MKISLVIFLASLVVVLIINVSIFFPVLLVDMVTEQVSEINSFEPGVWSLPVLLTNLVLLGLGIIYCAGKLPIMIQNVFRFILNFEISKKTTIIVIGILIGSYIIFSVEDLSIYEKDEHLDFERIELAVKNFPYVDISAKHGEEGIEWLSKLYVKNFFLYLSQTGFDNIKIIPFLASISLLILTYFFTLQIAKKRFAGVVAMIILLQSFSFLRYDTLATYSNFWTLFYLLSLYLVYKKWPLSPISFVSSILSKPLTVFFLPMTLFFIYRAEIPKRNKTYSIISYLIIFALMGATLGIVFHLTLPSTFNYTDFLMGFSTIAFQLRFDSLILLFLIPLTVGLYLTSKRGILEADSILMLIMGIILSAPILGGLSGFDVHPYRYIPLLVFFAIGVGILFSKNHSNGLKTVKV